MSSTPNTNIQASPDFSNFHFRTETSNGFIDRRVRFCGQKGGRIYQVEFSNLEAGYVDYPSWPKSIEHLDLVMTLVLIMKIYSERYPKRILRLSPDSQSEALLFGNLIGRFLLESVFIIELEGEKIEEGSEGPGYPPFRIRRRRIACISAHTLESSLHGVNRIFNSHFKIELKKSVRLSLSDTESITSNQIPMNPALTSTMEASDQHSRCDE
jgi:hypothetical protein